MLNPALTASTHPHLHGVGSQSSSNLSTGLLWTLQLRSLRKLERMAEFLKKTDQKRSMKSPSNENHLCIVRAKWQSLSPAWQLIHLHLATSLIPCNHGIKERTGSKPLQECFTLRSESGRWHTYYTGQLSKVLLPLVVLKREGYASHPPVPTRAWKWLPVRALTGTGRQTHATVPTGRKALGSLTRVCSCSSDER